MLNSDYLYRRQLETARFETDDESMILSAAANVLQDLGFTLYETETKLGLITAYKDREAGSLGEKTAIVLLAALGGTTPIYDTQQKIFTTLVTTKSKESQGYNVRIEFARIIWNNMNESRIEQIEESEIYRDFFDKLSQSLFLTAYGI